MFTGVTIVHQFLNLDQTPASGVVAFRLSARMTNASASYAPQVPVHSTLDGAGKLSQLLPANNDPGTLPGAPNTTFYVVTFFVNGSALSGDEQEITIPYDQGSVIDLGALLPNQQGA
jgi:hypothetical protein